ncbi:MAG: sterol desaturase family protein [Maribacter sp.]|uniref:sterol desaturase family protein n=1 Tax=Maribacter sp. TaxID=1897614 RepID=UPI003298469A
MLQKIGAFLDTFFRPLERFVHQYILGPFRWLLDKIDPFAEKIEGTVFKKILQIAIFPVFMILTVYVGFEMVKDGYTSRTFVDTIIMFLILGFIFAPLERLIPYSKKWIKDDETPVDIMLFFGSKLWGDYINVPLRLGTMAVVVQEISPTIGQEIWPTNLHPILQVFLLLTVADFFRYWYHRWMHESEFMWRWHAVHHSSERLYWFNGTRSHPLEYTISGLLWAIPFAFIKAPVEIVFVTGLVGRVIGRFQHTNMDVLLGPFDYIFSSPKNHRYHHSKKIHEGNSNYGGDVIIWDHLFGTFHMPKGEKPGDDIGINAMPNYPKTFIGLMLAPFTYGSIKKEAERIAVEDSKESSRDLAELPADK